MVEQSVGDHFNAVYDYLDSLMVTGVITPETYIFVCQALSRVVMLLNMASRGEDVIQY